MPTIALSLPLNLAKLRQLEDWLDAQRVTDPEQELLFEVEEGQVRCFLPFEETLQAMISERVA
jgi:hypothetical protein